MLLCAIQQQSASRGRGRRFNPYSAHHYRQRLGSFGLRKRPCFAHEMRWHASFGTTASYLQPCRSDHFCPLMMYEARATVSTTRWHRAFHQNSADCCDPQRVSFAVVSGWRLFISNQNDTADNDQNYSCKFRKGELFTKQEPDHHSGCNSPSNTDGSANGDRQTPRICVQRKVVD
jgi:hypothetical protein